jgi:hypothetical protein
VNDYVLPQYLKVALAVINEKFHEASMPSPDGMVQRSAAVFSRQF